MYAFVDQHRQAHGVEPICRVLPIAPSTYHAHVARRANPETAPARVKRDTALSVEIRRVFDENFQVYGVRKVWRQLLREGHDIARCTVARLMKKEALQGVIRGARVRTTSSDRATPCPLDHVHREFHAAAPRPAQTLVPKQFGDGAGGEEVVLLGPPAELVDHRAEGQSRVGAAAGDDDIGAGGERLSARSLVTT